MKNINILIVLCLLLTHYVFSEDIKIIGGKPVQGHFFDSVVALTGTHKGHEGKVYCNGVFIHKRVILTAAHCIEIAKDIGLSIYIGNGIEDSRLPIQNNFAIQKIEKFPGFDREKRATAWSLDIGYILLKQEVDGDFPIFQLVENGSDLSLSTRLNSPIQLVGFGKSNGNSPSGGLGLKRTVQTLVSDPYYSSSFLELTIGEKGKSGCQGDSGSPAFWINENEENPELKYKILAVTSRGPPCYGAPGVYALIAPALSWIELETGILFRSQSSLRQYNFLEQCKDSKDKKLKHTFSILFNRLNVQIGRCEELKNVIKELKTLDLSFAWISTLNPLMEAHNLESINIRGNLISIDELKILKNSKLNEIELNSDYYSLNDLFFIKNEFSSTLKINKDALQESILRSTWENNNGKIQFFHQEGASLDDHDSLGDTLLLQASKRGHIEAASSLLNLGANIDSFDLSNQYTPLMVAVLRYDLSLLDFLISQNANPRLKNRDSNTARGLAQILKFKKIEKILEIYEKKFRP